MHGTHFKKTLNMSSDDLLHDIDKTAGQLSDLERISESYPILNDRELRRPLSPLNIIEKDDGEQIKKHGQ